MKGYTQIQVKDADLRHLLAVMLVSNRHLLGQCLPELRDYARGMAKGKIIAIEAVQLDRDNERGHRPR